MKKKREIKRLGQVITIIILILVVIFSSTVCNLLEITAERTEIARESLETSIITVNNVLTKDGIKFLLDNMMSNVQVFKPIYLLIVSLIIMSIGEVSGLFKAVLKPFRRINPKVLTMFTLFIGISSSFFGEYSYAILLPLTAMIYQYTGKKPLLGIMTMFIGITMGYGTGLIYNNDEIILSKLTTAAATLDVDTGFT